MKTISSFLIVVSLLISSTSFAGFSYDEMIKFPDASVLIRGPRYTTEENEKRWISDRSQQDGVCKVFGFRSVKSGYPTVLYKRAESTGENEMLAVNLNEEGKILYSLLANYDIGMPNFATYMVHSPIDEIVCDSSDILPITPNTEAQITKEEANNFTMYISNPKIGGQPIASTSDANGVCKNFGFSGAFGGTMVVNNSTKRGRAISIGSDGRINGLMLHDYPILHLTCFK